MDLLIWAAVAAVLLLLLVLVARRRQGRGDAPHRPPSAGGPAHGSPSTNSWPLGGGPV